MEFGKKGDAKKAMKLHHKEGISLKQAWKRVSKFGMATVCADGYEANQLWRPDSRRNQCIKTCGFYEMRDPVTNRCKKMTMPGQSRVVLKPGYEINPETGRQRKICDPPKMRNDKGRCVGPRVITALPPGYEINPETGRRRKICDPPKMRNARGRCVGAPRQSSMLDLPIGYEINPDTGRRRKMCLPGYYRDPVTKRCRKIGDVIDGSRWAGVARDDDDDPTAGDDDDVSVSPITFPFATGVPVGVPMDFDPFPPSGPVPRNRRPVGRTYIDSNDPQVTLFFGRKHKKCGFGTCSACALKK